MKSWANKRINSDWQFRCAPYLPVGFNVNDGPSRVVEGHECVLWR